MTLQQRGPNWYGDSQDDIRGLIALYSASAGYPAERFADAKCHCGGRVFALELDDAEGVAVRTCAACSARHVIADGEEYLADAQLQECACPCGKEAFELTIGASLYTGSDNVRWLYVGARCPACGLTAVYGDWKNEYEGVDALLAKV